MARWGEGSVLGASPSSLGPPPPWRPSSPFTVITNKMKPNTGNRGQDGMKAAEHQFHGAHKSRALFTLTRGERISSMEKPRSRSFLGFGSFSGSQARKHHVERTSHISSMFAHVTSKVGGFHGRRQVTLTRVSGWGLGAGRGRGGGGEGQAGCRPGRDVP